MNVNGAGESLLFFLQKGMVLETGLEEELEGIKTGRDKNGNGVGMEQKKEKELERNIYTVLYGTENFQT